MPRKKTVDEDKPKVAETRKTRKTTRNKDDDTSKPVRRRKTLSNSSSNLVVQTPTQKDSQSNPENRKRTRVKGARIKDSQSNLQTSTESREKIFALDIGTRSVIGIVAVQEDDGTLTIVATHREEHKTRAMLDGQIHDVPQVAAVIKNVKAALEKQVGPLNSAAVAAAGRALYTVTATSEIEINGAITFEQERDLEFAAVQAAQANLAASHTIEDPTNYYCVGFSTIQYELDDVRLKTLVGQRGKIAKATVIATFLPRQVIDSMQSALQYSHLEMSALTLEPIAAINVLIPPTMRHLNLVLVDIGAGTSDVAITKNGSVIAYGMVPLAGDEVTEAISQKFLLDFNVAEEVKRKAANGQPAAFQDILGSRFDMSADEIIEPIIENIQGLANSIAKTVVELNNDEVPQAVMLVGGGSLTPRLHSFVAKALNMPDNRVAVRNPDIVEGITSIPKELRLPDAVTPLGILKIASIESFHFLTVFVNDVEYNLFHFRDLSVSDALLSAGIQLRKFNGKPGLGMMITVDGIKKTFQGSMGTLAKISVDGEEAALDTPIKNNSYIQVIAGQDGQTPKVYLKDVISELTPFEFVVNGEAVVVPPKILVNGQVVDNSELESEQSSLDSELRITNSALKDGDEVVVRTPRTIGEALRMAGFPPTGRKIKFTLNGRQSHYNCSPTILMNDSPVQISLPVHQGDSIEYIANDMPKISDVIKVNTLEATVTIHYLDQDYEIPAASSELKLNGRPASKNAIIDDEATIEYKSTTHAVTVSDALLAIDFKAPDPRSRIKFKILVNKKPVDFADPINNGDTLEIELTPPEEDPDLPQVPPEFQEPKPQPVRTPLKELRERKKLTISDFIRPD